MKIARRILPKYKIKEYIVKKWFGDFPEDIAIPEDDEVILVSENNEFPNEIILEVIEI
ncbi:hypothetical protein ACFLXE_04470 [Chloroflexota bacterium]